ncbi:MAG TPA: hypothetical protein VF459_08915 [Caulobacteraceae bacterium]
MSHRETAIDHIGVELGVLARQYAEKAEALATDAYFREAVVKVSVSGFVWALYDVFQGSLERDALDAELKNQSAVISRTLSAEGSVK